MAIEDIIVSSLIGTGFGGLLVGLVTFWINGFNRKNTVKEKHLKDHKENLEILMGYLNKVTPEINFLVNGEYTAFSYIPRKPNLEKFETWPSFAFGFYYEEGKGETKLFQVDTYLYNDLQNHFQELSHQLERTEKEFRRLGKIFSNEYYLIFRNIYEGLADLDESKFKILYPYIIRSVSFYDHVDVFCQENSGLGNALFYILLETPLDRWINLYNAYKGDRGLLDDLYNLARDLSSKIQEVIINIKKSRSEFDELYHNLLSSLEKQVHLNYLSGNCECLKLR